MTALTATPADGVIAVAAPDRLVLETLCLDAPPMAGAEYLTPETFGTLWSQIEAAVKTELAACGGKAQLLSLLLPVQKAAQSCSWLGEMVTEGEIYHPMRWRVEDAVRFLQDASQLQAAGIVVRMPKNSGPIYTPHGAVRVA